MEDKVFFIIILATIMHASWNAMVKKHSDKTVALAGIILGHIPLSVVAIIILQENSLFYLIDLNEFFYMNQNYLHQFELVSNHFHQL